MDRAGLPAMLLVLASILLAASSLHGHAAAAGQKGGILVAVVDAGGRVVGLGLHGGRLAVATAGGSVAVYALSSGGAEKLFAARTGLDAVDVAPTGDGGVLVCGRDGVLYLLRRDGSVADRFTPSDYDLLRGRPRRCLETLPWLVAYNDSIYFISSSGGRIEEIASASNYALLGSWSRGLGAADGAAAVLEGAGRVPAAVYVSSDGSVIGLYSFMADEAVAAPTGGLGEPCQLRVGGSGWAAVIAGNGTRVAVARLPAGPARNRPGAVKALELPAPAAAVAWNGSSLVAVAADGGVYEAAAPAWKPRRVASLGVSLPACAASAAEPRYGLLAVAGGGKVYVLKLGGKPLPAPSRHSEEKTTTRPSSTPRASSGSHAAGGETGGHATGTTTRQATASTTAEKTSGEKTQATATSRNVEKTGSATKTAATARTRATTRPAGEKNETSSATARTRTGAAAETGGGAPAATEPPQEAKRSQQAGGARHATAEENAEKPTARATGSEAPRGPAGPGSEEGAAPAALLAAAAALAALAAAKTRRSRE